MGTTTALFAFTSGAGAALAAPGDTARATGQFLSGSLFSQPLSQVVDLSAETATNNGSQPTQTSRDNINLTALGALNVQLPGGVQLPLNVANAGVLGQYANANADGSSAGASGAIGSDGQIGVGPTGGTGDLTFSLGGVVSSLGLNPALLSEVAALDLTVGAVSARASQVAPAAPVGSYTIADADLTFDSATLGNLVTVIRNQIATTQTALNGLQANLGASVRGVPLLGAATVNVGVAVPNLLTPVNNLLTQDLSSGGVTIDLDTGVVSVDLAVLNNLNNLPPSTNLLGAAQLNAITSNITSLVSGLVTSVGTTLQSTIDGIAVTGGISLPLVGNAVTINTTLGSLLDGSSTGVAVTLLGLNLNLGLLVGALTAPLASVGNLGNVIGILSPLVLTPVVNLVVPAIAPVLNAAVGLTANVQSTTAGVFSETALRVTVLPGGAALVADLANATVGPNVAVPDPAITGIAPPQGPESGGTSVTLTGTNFTNVTSVTIGGNVVTALTVTPTTITFATPPHAAGAVPVVVNALQGNSAPATFTYLAVPAASTSLTPTSGTQAGGTPVTITGSGFIGATGVTFNGAPATGFSVVNDTTITVTSPAGAVGPAAVVVLDPAGNSAPLTYNYLAVASAATGIAPGSGPVVGGTPVTITGSGFLGATGVTFSGAPATGFAVVNDTTITATSPAGALGGATVVVVDPAGNSAPLPFQYLAQPSIAGSLSPVSGTELGGTAVTITGSGFLGATGVTFDGTPGTAFTVVNDTTITVATPRHTPGSVAVVVVDPAGNSGPLAFQYLGFPSAVTTVAPNQGPETGGTTVTITGSGFTGASAVTFDGTPGTNFAVVNDGSITVTSPAHAPGPVDLIVVDASGNSTPVTFTYFGVPSAATSLTPDSGTELGGTAVTINGSGFLGATGVTFDGTPGTAFAVVSDTEITVTTPANAPGDADVVVVDPAGNSGPLTFEFIASPSVAATIDPAAGPAAGGTPVTITGTGFVGATGVTFDGNPGTAFTVVSDTEITVTSPAGTAGTVDVVVTDPAGDSDPLDFEYLAEPAVATTLDPATGTELGGTVVTVSGSGFLGATGVTFDGVAGTGFTVVNDTTITVATPEHVPGAVDVIVLDPAGNSAPPLIFTYVGDPAAVDSITPAVGPETGGTEVTLEGSGFTNATGVTFDGIPGTDFVVDGDGTITVTSPVHAPGPVDVVVADPSGASAPVTFTYLAVPSDAESLTPTEGTELGGTSVTITGTGFVGATGVTFDGIAGTDFTVVSDTEITVTTPQTAPGIVDVVVIDPAGDSDPLDFEFLAIASVATSLDPTFGPAAGGTAVTITGTGFTGATGVTFGGTPGTDFVVVNDTTITVTSPAGDPVIVDVVVLDPAGDSDPLPFEYDAQPSIANFISPPGGPETGNTGVTILGSGFFGATGVTFDGIAGTNFTVLTDSLISVTSPAHLPGAVDVVVLDAAGNSVPLTFTYVGAAAVVDTITPDAGPETGGYTVTLEGSGFTNSTGVTFDGIPATDFTATDTTITVTVPAHAPGPVDVIVADVSGDSTAVTFTYESVASAITTLTPDEGTELGGTEVIIEGTGFTGATGVTFDGIDGIDFTVDSDTQITVTTPAHAPEVVDVIVVDVAGGNSAAFDFEFLAIESVATTITPDFGPAAGSTPVTITGTGFTGATAVEFNGVPGTAFTVDSDTQIRVTSPAGTAGIADVIVIDAAGNSAPLAFEYIAAPAVATEINPATGTELGGTPVTITGTGFLEATGVTFGGTPGTAFTVVNDTTITVTTPANAPGAVGVIVLDPTGNSAPITFTYVGDASVVATIVPDVGPETGGTEVTLSGSGFTGATGVTFGGVPGTAFTVVDDTTITVTSPANAPGLVDVIVLDPVDDSSPVGFTYEAEPSIAASLTPDEGDEIGGDIVTITGSGFLGATGVTFDGTLGTAFTVVDDNTITVTSPSHAPGVVDVVVLDDEGDSAPLPFEYLAIVSDATTITPDEGSVVGGLPVVIDGSGFTGATGVTFDGVPGTGFTVVNDTQITVTTPEGTPGTADVVVIDPAGGDSEPIDFLYVADPAAAISLSPLTGTELGGTVVTIDGSGFLGATGVTFDGLAGVNFQVLSDTQISVATPRHLPGLVDVIVVDPAGNSAPLGFTYVGFPSVSTSLTPDTGSEAGGDVVTITGTGFTGASGVTFDGLAGTAFTVVSDTSITVTSPAHAPGLVDVIVVDGSGSSAALDFTYEAEASAAISLSPTRGDEAGGTPVTITGTGFLGATDVTFNGTPGTNFTVVSDTSITVISPAGTPGTAAVVVVDPTGNSGPLDFEYFASAAVATSVTPATGPVAGGTPVTVNGSGFTGSTGVTFGGTPGTDFTVVSDTVITVTTPVGTPGVVDVVVLDPTGDSDPLDFVYEPAASVATSLTPIEGTELGGTPVTITGTGFLGATGVLFDGLAGTAFTVVNDTTITVTSPAHAPGPVGVFVADPTGSSAPLTFTYVGDAPVVDTIDPAAGPETGGTDVTLSGTGFTGATGVTFGGVPGTAFTVVDDNTITVTSPANAPGLVDVIVLDPVAPSAPVDFTYEAEASVAASLTPDEGDEIGGDIVTITGSGFLGATGVTFDGTLGTAFTVLDDTTITVTSPSHAPGVVDVVVVDAAGSSGALDFEYLAIAADATSITPSSGPVVGGTPVTIIGTGFTGATGVTFNGVPGTAFTVVDDTQITVTTPPGAEGTAAVVVLDPAGDSDPLDFLYGAEASVATSLSPLTGTELGGTVVTIDGSGFLGATGVTFDGIAGTAFTVVDDNTISVATPRHLPGLVSVVVVDPAGNSGPLSFTYVGFPSVAATISPGTGSEAGGTLVTIGGTGFTGASGVTFDGIPGTAFTVVSDTSITVTSPAHAPGVVGVVVVDGAGSSAPLPFTYEAVASVATTLTPDEGDEAGGTPVTITGSGFIGATDVTFNGIPGTNFTVVSDTSITVTSPAGTPGTAAVIVVDPAGDSDPLDFEYFASAADAESITPATGPVAGGTPVTIIGSGFAGSTGVEFDGTPGTDFVVVSDTEISVTTPVGTPGTAEVVVIDPAGDSDPLGFVYVAAAANATAIDPTTGTELGGTEVTITGTGFLGATDVLFDGTAGTGFTVVSDTEITVTTPAHAPRAVNVVVVDPIGNSGPLVFTYVGIASVVDTIDPDEGPETGGTDVTLSGSGFTGATGVTFDGIAGTDFEFVNDTTITVTSPAHAPGVVDVIVLDPTANSAPVDFTYNAIESDATSLAPDQGDEIGGDNVTITGTGFLGSTGVTFDGTPGTNFTVVSDTSITVTSPAHAPGVVDVIVVDPAGDSEPLDFEYLAAAAVATSIDPATGPVVGGTTVTIIGSGFTGSTGVEFNGTPGTGFTVVSDTEISVTTPPGTEGTAEVVVLDPAGDSDPIDFEFLGQPAIAVSLDPATGTELGGTVVTVTGSGFLGSTGVLFDGVAGTNFTVVNDTTITVAAPAHAPGEVGVFVADPAGSSSPLLFTYVGFPSVVSTIDPDEGTEAGGTEVTLSGTGFTGATGVTFGGVPGTAFTVVNDSTIRVTSPANAPGVVDVVVLDPTADSTPVDFTYLAVASAATSLTPDEGNEIGGTGVTVTGTGFLGATAVEFDGIEGTAFTVVNDTTITVTSPPHAPGEVDVVVVDAAGDSPALDFEYLAVAAVATSIDPATGPVVGGTVVTIIGSGFTGSTGVTFDGTPGTGFTVVSDTEITVTTPPGTPGTVEVVVLDPAGDSDPIDFEFLAAPAVATSLTPISGTELGGTIVTISGSGFLGATGVNFDATPGVDFEVVNDTTITVTTPAHLPGPVSVVVLDPAGNSGPLAYEFVGFPSIAATIDPTEGSEAGGTEVTITGSGFTGANSVTFDGIAGTEFDVVNDSTITVTSPAHAPGPVEVIVVDGSGNSAPLDYLYIAVASDADSLSPTEGTELGGTTVTVTGSGFLGATAVEFDGTAGTEFTVVDDTTITVTTPAHVPAVVDVVVIDPTGDSGALDYEFLAIASDAASLTPDSGTELGGTLITITGSGFTGATGVEFDGTPGTGFTVVDDNTITVVTPENAPGVVDVIVLDPAGDSEPLPFEFLAQASAATSLTPTEGPETGGTAVTITGTGFVGATAVEFDGTPGTAFTVVDDTTITVTTPANAAGPAGVVVVDAAGNSAPLDFTFLAEPSTVDTIVPDEGPETGGTTVTLTGSGFTGATAVTFDGIDGTDFTVVDDTTITVVSPAHLAGTVDLVVIDEAGGNSAPVDFTYVGEASDIASLTPVLGPDVGGTAVTITGSGFLGSTGVEFDGLTGLDFTVVDDSTITVTSPAHAPGLVGLVVLDPAGDSDPAAFEYVEGDIDVLGVPSVAASLEPPFGPVAGGTVVTIDGSGFLGATGVEFDGTLGTEFDVVDDFTIIVTTPAHPAGVVDVVVADPEGNSDPLDFEYDAEAATAASIDPVVGSEAGGTEVTITGSGFTGATGVTFDGLAGTTFTVVDDETITAVTPAHAPGAVDVIVVDPAGSSAPFGFTYFPLADIGVVDPSTGPEAGGTTVTISGTCFTGATAVLFGDVEVTDFEVNEDGTTITVVSPAGSGTVDVTVVGTEECGTTTEEDGYTYEPAPSVVDTIDPPRGPQTGGTTVTIGGDGFTGSTGVDFGGVPGTDVTVVDDNTITVVTPATGIGTVGVVVLDPAGNSVPVDYEFFGVGDIDTVAPSSGPSGGGTTVTISGQCFTGATDVRFGNNSAKSFSVNAAGTQIKAVTPAGSGTVDVTVVGAGDCGSTTLDDAFQYTTFGLPSTGVEIAGAALSALLLLVGGAFALVIRRREQGEN